MANDVWVLNDGLTPADYVSAAGYSTVGYDPRARAGRCIAKDHTCRGFSIKGSRYCAGHDKALQAGIKRRVEELAARQQETSQLAADEKFAATMAEARQRMWGHP